MVIVNRLTKPAVILADPLFWIRYYFNILHYSAITNWKYFQAKELEILEA